MRSRWRGGTQGAGSSRVGAAPGSGALHASGRTPTYFGRGRRRQLRRGQDGGRCLCSCSGGTAHERERPRPRGPPTRAGPLLPSVCPLSAAATATAKANVTAALAAATTAALLGARRGLMLSSAASPPFWAPRAATILHILAPSPSLPRPRLAGSGHTPFPSRDCARAEAASRVASPAGRALTERWHLTTP